MCFTTLHYNAALESCRLHYVTYNRRHLVQLDIYNSQMNFSIAIHNLDDTLFVFDIDSMNVEMKRLQFKSQPFYSNYMRHDIFSQMKHVAAGWKLAKVFRIFHFQIRQIIFQFKCILSYCRK